MHHITRHYPYISTTFWGNQIHSFLQAMTRIELIKPSKPRISVHEKSSASRGMILIVAYIMIWFLGQLSLTPSLLLAQELRPADELRLLKDVPVFANFSAQAETTYVGAVEESETLIAFVIQHNTALAYLCDGQGLVEWQFGQVIENQLDVTTDQGGRLTATLTEQGIQGAVTFLDGDGNASEHVFIATHTTSGETGLVREETLLGDGSLVIAGWILHVNVTRGAIQQKEVKTFCNKWNSELKIVQQEVFTICNSGTLDECVTAFDDLTVLEGALARNKCPTLS